jgi:hypothetical protein
VSKVFPAALVEVRAALERYESEVRATPPDRFEPAHLPTFRRSGGRMASQE